MKYTFLVVFLFIACGQYLIGQEVTTEDQTEESTTTQSSILGNIDINITDSLDLEVLDSIVRSLDTILNNIKPSSGIYGHDMFRSDSLSFYKPGSIVKVPDNYVVGASDEIAVSIFGLSQLDAKLVVDVEGYVAPEALPKVFLKGVKWSQARELLKRRYSNYYRFKDDQFAASIIKPRVVTVNVFGEVNQPGTFTFEGTNNAFNALVAAKGPSINGSVRNIIINDGSTQRTMDLYQLLNNPSAQFDLYLDDNSIIQVPIARKLVTLKGAVKRPMMYELTEQEGLKALMNYAGGPMSEAALEVVQIKRYNGKGLVVIDSDYSALLRQGQDLQLQNGDVIEVKSLSDHVENSAFVEGAVQVEGEFAISDNSRISDLIKKARLNREARTDLAYLIRMNPDSTFRLLEINIDDILKSVGSNIDLIVQEQDRIVVNELGLYVDKSTISVKGAVRKEINYPFDNNAQVKLNQALSLAGGLDTEAADIGYIIRSNPSNKNDKEYVEVNFRKALQNVTGSENKELQPWDEVVVLQNSRYTDVSTVNITGSVRSPRKIQYASSLRLKDVIVLGGGLKQEASQKIQIFRLNIDQSGKSNTESIEIEVDDDYNIVNGPNDFQLEPFDEIVIRNVSEFELQNFVEIEGEVKTPGKYALVSDSERLVSLIERSGGLTNEAFISGAYVMREKESLDDDSSIVYFKLVTDLNAALSNRNSKFNYIIKPGDVVVLPKNENVVYINLANTKARSQSGSDKIGVLYDKGKNAKWYIDKYAGGFGYDADKKGVLVEYAGGGTQGTRGGLFKKYPLVENGATISIGSKGVKNNSEKNIDNTGYPRLRKGVIINVSPDGTATNQVSSESENGNL